MTNVVLPENTCLGKLQLIEVYEYLDGARLFLTKNKTGFTFLVYWCDEKVNATGWLYLPISRTRLTQLKQREMMLNAAFKAPETNYYYLAYTGHENGKDTAKMIYPAKLDPDFIPPKGYYLYADQS